MLWLPLPSGVRATVSQLPSLLLYARHEMHRSVSNRFCAVLRTAHCSFSKSYGEKVVNARVKLLFKSMNGKTMVATRNLKSTVEANKTKMRQLGGSLVIANPDGTRENLSHHCTELNSQMETFLGVSKPILSNVIFCHQDESAWPMSEASALKKKFDDIFAAARYEMDNMKLRSRPESRNKRLRLKNNTHAKSTHASVSYIKALEELKKKRLSHSKQVRESEGFLQRAKEHKTKAEEVRCATAYFHHLRLSICNTSKNCCPIPCSSRNGCIRPKRRLRLRMCEQKR